MGEMKKVEGLKFSFRNVFLCTVIRHSPNLEKKREGGGGGGQHLYSFHADTARGISYVPRRLERE